jgi:SAM-dependent methyltransferase
MCPICRTGTEPAALCKATLGDDTSYDLVECRVCEVRYLSPVPSAEQLAQFYRPEYYGSDWYKQQGWGMAFAKTVLGRLPPGRFLDVGCGLGFFIDSVRRHTNWQVYGVEFAPEAVAYAREELGLDVRQGDLADAGYEEEFFDYVQIRNVLEHVTSPMALLAECRRILKPGGVLHLFVPNGSVDSLDLINYYRTEGRAGFSKSGHLFFFSKETLARMFDEIGFRVERERTYGIRRGLASLGYWPRLKDWKRHYAPKDSAPIAGGGRISLPRKKERPDLYYLYRLHRMNLRMLPGLRRFGLDFEIILRRNV